MFVQLAGNASSQPQCCVNPSCGRSLGFGQRFCSSCGQRQPRAGSASVVLRTRDGATVDLDLALSIRVGSPSPDPSLARRVLRSAASGALRSMAFSSLETEAGRQSLSETLLARARSTLGSDVVKLTVVDCRSLEQQARARVSSELGRARRSVGVGRETLGLQNDQLALQREGLELERQQLAAAQRAQSQRRTHASRVHELELAHARRLRELEQRSAEERSAIRAREPLPRPPRGDEPPKR